MWPFKRMLGEERTTAKELAETLYSELLNRRHCDVPEGTHVEASVQSALDAKIKMYQFCAVLLALLSEAQRNPEFSAVREHFQQCYLPSQFDFDLLMKVRATMGNLSALLKVSNAKGTTDFASRGISWARNWLGEIGIVENNPARLSLFAINWIDYYVAITKALKDFTLL